MPMRFTRPSMLVLSLVFAGCAAHGSDDVLAPDADVTGDDDGGATGPGAFDSGPPATINDGTDAGHPSSGGDAGSGGDSGGNQNTTCDQASQCPGAGKPNAAVACTSHTCSMSCNGESYDVNGDPNDGCEVADAPSAKDNTPFSTVDDHTNALAADLGSYGCNDGGNKQFTVSGVIPSDAREHTPAIDGFDATTGAAPDYFKVYGSGGACYNDANVAIQLDAPAKQMACYELHLLTDKQGEQKCTTDLTGRCSITNGSGSYSDNSEIYFWVVKTASCSGTLFPDDAAYHIDGHI